MIIVSGKMSYEAILGNFTSLREAVHTFVDLNKDTLINKEFFQVILSNDTGRELSAMDAHVFRTFHGGAEVVVVDIQRSKVLPGRYADIEKDFERSDIGCVGGNFAMPVCSVATIGATDTITG